VADTPRGPAGIRRIAWRAPAARRGEPPALRPLGYLPALDGIRALAVIAVFVFHAGFGWASGGFLGVSVFFTLSGYLITRLLLGLATWGNQTGALRVVGKDAGLGCPIARGGEIKYMDRPPFDPFEKCGDWGVDWAGIVDQTRPDVAVIVDAPFDIADRLLPGDTQWRAIGDPVFDQYLESELLAATDLFLARGIKVVWVNTPLMEAGHWDAVKSQYPENDPARVRRFNRMLGEIAAVRPGVTMIDLRSWLRQTPGGENNWDLRPDGVHFTEGAAVMVAGWLGPAILNAVRPPPAV